jgi:ArsR family transcriptional regulator
MRRPSVKAATVIGFPWQCLALRDIVNRRLSMTQETRPRRLNRSDPLCCPPDEPAMARSPAVEGPLDDAAAIEELAMFAKALGHPTRVRILRMLAKKEARMCSLIVDELPLAQSSVSEHLRILKAAGLIRGREDGPRVAYCIESAMLQRMKTLLGAM